MLSLPPIARFADFGPFILRVTIGIIMLAHGLQKLVEFGPANFDGLLTVWVSHCRCSWATW